MTKTETGYWTFVGGPLDGASFGPGDGEMFVGEIVVVLPQSKVSEVHHRYALTNGSGTCQEGEEDPSIWSYNLQFIGTETKTVEWVDWRKQWDETPPAPEAQP